MLNAIFEIASSIVVVIFVHFVAKNCIGIFSLSCNDVERTMSDDVIKYSSDNQEVISGAVLPEDQETRYPVVAAGTAFSICWAGRSR